MKQKIFNFSIILLCILFIVLLLNSLRNYIILNNIELASKNFSDTCTNFYFQEIITIDGKNLATEEIYHKDNIYNATNYSFKEVSTIKFTSDYKILEKSGSVFESTNEGNLATWDNTYKYILSFDKNKKIELFKNYIFKPIPIENNYYKIKYDEHCNILVNKESNLIEIKQYQNARIKLLLNVVTDEDIY